MTLAARAKVLAGLKGIRRQISVVQGDNLKIVQAMADSAQGLIYWLKVSRLWRGPKSRCSHRCRSQKGAPNLLATYPAPAPYDGCRIGMGAGPAGCIEIPGCSRHRRAAFCPMHA